MQLGLIMYLATSKHSQPDSRRIRPACIQCLLCDSLRTPYQKGTVHYVQWHPAASKEDQHQCQGSSQPPLPKQGGPSLGQTVSQMALEAPEETGVEQGHDQQGNQNTTQEVEVNHEWE